MNTSNYFDQIKNNFSDVIASYPLETLARCPVLLPNVVEGAIPYLLRRNNESIVRDLMFRISVVVAGFVAAFDGLVFLGTSLSNLFDGRSAMASKDSDQAFRMLGLAAFVLVFGLFKPIAVLGQIASDAPSFRDLDKTINEVAMSDFEKFVAKLTDTTPTDSALNINRVFLGVSTIVLVVSLAAVIYLK